MNDREKRILHASMALFLRYGVKRTSMNDISQEAGISRQTLYNAFRNKDEVLCALIRYHGEQTREEIAEGLQAALTLGEQLDLIFDRVAVSAYDLLTSSPNSSDILEGFNKLSQEEIDAAYGHVREVLVDLLEPHAGKLAKHGLSTGQLADFIQRSVKAMKHCALSREHLLELLRTLRIAVLNLAGAE